MSAVAETYKWALVPEQGASIPDIREALLEAGFNDDGDGEFVQELLRWNPFRAKIKEGGDEIVFSFHWPGSEVTTKYYDYLVKAGTVIERVRVHLERKPPKQLESSDGSG